MSEIEDLDWDRVAYEWIEDSFRRGETYKPRIKAMPEHVRTFLEKEKSLLEWLLPEGSWLAEKRSQGDCEVDQPVD